MTPACLAILLAALVGMADGLYFHLWRDRLHQRPECLREHVLHTLRVTLFVPVVYLLFARNHGGLLLWVGAALVLLDLGLQSWDTWIEDESRRRLGGLSSGEYRIHVHATVFHVAGVSLCLASKPAEAWSFDSPWVLATPLPDFARFTAWCLLPGGVAAALLHWWLLLPRHRRDRYP